MGVEEKGLLFQGGEGVVAGTDPKAGEGKRDGGGKEEFGVHGRAGAWESRDAIKLFSGIRGIRPLESSGGFWNAGGPGR